MKSLLLLGSTGSIGTQTLDLVRAQPDVLRVSALGARSSAEAVLAQAHEFRPEVVALVDPQSAERIRAELPAGTALRTGPDVMEELAAEASYDLAVHGMVGAAGVRPSAAVLARGKSLALANKESLVAAGEPLMELARRTGADVIPVDSEHSAIFQCLRGEDPGRVRRVYLTASGGALRELPLDQLDSVTPEMALQHPNWDMGPRITIGSATLMNKALEVIETHHLFGLASEQIEVVLHRQSIVHSMVEFVDGSVLAQMGPPDMRGPIHYAIHFPQRMPAGLQGFDLELFSQLTFEAPDPRRFPLLELGRRCVELGGDSGSVLNAADEVAVGAFLEGRIPFQDIGRIDRRVLDRRPGCEATVEGLLGADARARELAAEEVAKIPASAARA